MQLYSTNNPSQIFDLKQAVLQGLPADNGLFMPKHIPKLPPGFIDHLEQRQFPEIALEVSKTLLGSAIDRQSLEEMVADVFNFDLPLVQVESNIYTLELYHGPTLAFKDFGARFMARLMSYLLEGSSLNPCVLVATSGDTGSAVAQGFYKVPGIDVVILYPSGKVSEIQEKQLTTVGENVTALEVEGTFDDCQALVKKAFLDTELKERRHLTSANSINIARLIPQSFYYFELYARLKQLNMPITCSVPSGNFGNLMGGLLAKAMGVPIDKFIAANNANRVFFDYLQSGSFKPRPSVPTISNAMDVGNPSNFVRILELFDGDYSRLAKEITGYTFDDDITKETIASVYKDCRYLLDPHGAVGYLGLKEYFKTCPGGVGVFLGTAHPVKFLDVVQPLIEGKVPVPESLKQVLSREKSAIAMPNSFQELKQFLLKH